MSEHQRDGQLLTVSAQVRTHRLLFLSDRSAKMIPEDDQIFTEVELNLLEKVINETTVGGNYFIITVETHSVILKVLYDTKSTLTWITSENIGPQHVFNTPQH